MNKNAPAEHETAEQSSSAVHTIHQEEFMALAMRQMNPEADITEKLTEKHIDKMHIWCIIDAYFKQIRGREDE